MRRMALVLLLTLAVLSGCAKGAPNAVTPETEYDFGDVPVTSEVRINPGGDPGGLLTAARKFYGRQARRIHQPHHQRP